MDVIEEKSDPNKHPKPPVCWRSPPRYIVGVDLGQASDPTAVCILEAYAEREDPAAPANNYFDVRHLMRLPLGMSYPAIVADVGVMIQRPPLTGVAELVIDETGVGRAVGDIFQQHGLKPIRVTITAGDSRGEMAGNARYTVSKSFLVSNLDAKLHTGELRFAKELREAPALESELKDFRRHVSEAGRYSFEARTGAHDDLVLAVAIALWRATKKKPHFEGPRFNGVDGKPRVILGYGKEKGRL